MASFDKRYISVCDPQVSSTTYVHIRSKSISENIKTDYLQYGDIESKGLSFIKSQNSYSGQITTNFRPWESRFFLRSFFGVARSEQSSPSTTENYSLTSNYNPINIKVANGDPNTVGVEDEFITLQYDDILINKIDFDLKSKDLSNVSFSYIAKDVSKINDLDITYDLSNEPTIMFYNIDIVLSPSSGDDIVFDDVKSCKISMNNGGSNDNYHISNNNPSDIKKKQNQSGFITFDFDGYSTDNFALRLNDLDCSLSYDVNIKMYSYDSITNACEFTFNNCVITETKRDLNRSRDASKSISLIADLTDMDMEINNCVYEELTADFTYTGSGLDISFNGSYPESVTNVYWDFGDGSYSYATDPVHTYNNTGAYNVRLVVTDYIGREKNITKEINICYTINVNFTYSVLADTYTVRFSDSSVGNIVSKYWDFDDGNYSTEDNPDHTYSSHGLYTVRLTVFDYCGNNDYVDIDVCANGMKYAWFTESINGLVVTFTESCSDCTNSWLWDFGDGNTSTEQNPIHTYSASGDYYVELQSTDCCNRTSNIIKEIQV